MPYKLLTINYKLMKRIVFATNNQHKLQEIRDILGSGYEVVSLKEIGCDVDIPETGNTLEENALQKAQYVYDHYHVSCFADEYRSGGRGT
ncbi:non-canonical purine NTP pyrophosphatase, RdgB/HAM1 family [human gut metagenome]|uniref:Non-canonical purine NTP pyrophosphatase, RdgB/HAM1 family n=1 Tax=human gut metagenome TaxID=408170 RepID=K1SSS8_9ZZZZ